VRLQPLRLTAAGAESRRCPRACPIELTRGGGESGELDRSRPRLPGAGRATAPPLTPRGPRAAAGALASIYVGDCLVTLARPPERID